ncbi:uncharacterized protein [Choristoneura fumiferana]|uniref:uncharacterized protein n=1 Tax=Choristoneura fumiferana TaxID=7141 RepID=UPI003D1582F5
MKTLLVVVAIGFRFAEYEAAREARLVVLPPLVLGYEDINDVPENKKKEHELLLDKDVVMDSMNDTNYVDKGVTETKKDAEGDGETLTFVGTMIMPHSFTRCCGYR